MRLKQLQGHLEGLDSFTQPKIQYEQYATDAHLAARMLYTAENVYHDIQRKRILDLGCGGGALALGAALMGARHVLGLDIDPDALRLARRNAGTLTTECDELHQIVRWRLCDVEQLSITAPRQPSSARSDTATTIASQTNVSSSSSVMAAANATTFSHQQAQGGLVTAQEDERTSREDLIQIIEPTASVMGATDTRRRHSDASDTAVEAAVASNTEKSFELDAWSSDEEEEEDFSEDAPLESLDSLPAGYYDTILMNPPFGTKTKLGIDMIFLKKALDLTGHAVYSMHKSSTRGYIERKALSEWGCSEATVLAQMRFDLPKTYRFHRQSSVAIDVDLWRFARRRRGQ